MYYGKLRTTDWPRREYPPVVQPLFDPAVKEFWCHWAEHWATERAPDLKSLGCKDHPSWRWRNVRTPIPGGGMRITTRYCDTCKAFRPYKDFERLTPKEISKVCTPCRNPKPTNLWTPPKGKEKKNHFCVYCRQVKPVTAFSRMVLSMDQRVCDTCGERLAA